jgi:hypothetical protein
MDGLLAIVTAAGAEIGLSMEWRLIMDARGRG